VHRAGSNLLRSFGGMHAYSLFVTGPVDFVGLATYASIVPSIGLARLAPALARSYVLIVFFPVQLLGSGGARKNKTVMLN
jgi:hypothetical protein